MIRRARYKVRSQLNPFKVACMAFALVVMMPTAFWLTGQGAAWYWVWLASLVVTMCIYAGFFFALTKNVVPPEEHF